MTVTDSPAQLEAKDVVLGGQASGELRLLGVPIVDQVDYASCGEAAYAMAWDYLHPGWRLDVPILVKVGLALDVYHPSQGSKGRGYQGTSPAGMSALGNFLAVQFQVIPPETGQINLANGDPYAQLEAKGLIYRQLSAGFPIILDVTDIIGAPSPSFNDSHFVTVTGMDFTNGLVRYNDPLIGIGMSGTVSGADRIATWKAIWASWSRNRDVDPGVPGFPGRGWYMVVH